MWESKRRFCAAETLLLTLGLELLAEQLTRSAIVKLPSLLLLKKDGFGYENRIP